MRSPEAKRLFRSSVIFTITAFVGVPLDAPQIYVGVIFLAAIICGCASDIVTTIERASTGPIGGDHARD